MLILQLVFNAQLISENVEMITDIIFSDDGENQVIIPANAIRHQRLVGKGIKICYAIIAVIYFQFKVLECQWSII